MKKLCGILLAGIFLIAPANAQMSVGITLDSYTGYIWRGYVLGADDKLWLSRALRWDLVKRVCL